MKNIAKIAFDGCRRANLASTYFAFQHFNVTEKKPIHVVVNKPNTSLKENFSPAVCYPDMASSEKPNVINANVPLYVVQLLSVRKPSSIQNIANSLNIRTFQTRHDKKKKLACTLCFMVHFLQEKTLKKHCKVCQRVKITQPVGASH